MQYEKFLSNTYMCLVLKFMSLGGNTMLWGAIVVLEPRQKQVNVPPTFIQSSVDFLVGFNYFTLDRPFSISARCGYFSLSTCSEMKHFAFITQKCLIFNNQFIFVLKKVKIFHFCPNWKWKMTISCKNGKMAIQICCKVSKNLPENQ